MSHTIPFIKLESVVGMNSEKPPAYQRFIDLQKAVLGCALALDPAKVFSQVATEVEVAAELNA